MLLLTTYRVWQLNTIMNDQCIYDLKILFTENSNVSNLNILFEFEYKFLRFLDLTNKIVCFIL